MKTSALIKKLQKLQDKHGDLPVKVFMEDTPAVTTAEVLPDDAGPMVVLRGEWEL